MRQFFIVLLMNLETGKARFSVMIHQMNKKYNMRGGFKHE